MSFTTLDHAIEDQSNHVLASADTLRQLTGVPAGFRLAGMMLLRAKRGSIRFDLPDGEMKTDEYFGEMEVYLDGFLGKLAIARATPEAMEPISTPSRTAFKVSSPSNASVPMNRLMVKPTPVRQATP